MWDKSGLSGNWSVNSLGILQNNVNGSSLDYTLTINILKGTKMLDTSGNSLAEMSVAPIASPAVAPKGYHILKSFNFDPEGAQFDPGITITISFNASDVTNGKTLVLAFYNETDGKWEFIEGTNNGDGDVTANFTITHFSVYSLMSKTSTHSIWFWIAVSGSGAIILLLAALIYRRLKKSTNNTYNTYNI